MHGQRLDVSHFDNDEFAMDTSFRLHFETLIDSESGIIRVINYTGRGRLAPSAWGVLGDASRRHGTGMRSLVTFANDHFRDGAIIDEMQFPILGIDNTHQVGAVVWSSITGLVDQIYVSPEHRRTKMAKKVLHLASACHHTHGWGGHIHGDGRRTDLGEAFTSTMRRQHLIAPHSELSPPMDPQ